MIGTASDSPRLVAPTAPATTLTPGPLTGDGDLSPLTEEAATVAGGPRGNQPQRDKDRAPNRNTSSHSSALKQSPKCAA